MDVAGRGCPTGVRESSPRRNVPSASSRVASLWLRKLFSESAIAPKESAKLKNDCAVSMLIRMAGSPANAGVKAGLTVPRISIRAPSSARLATDAVRIPLRADKYWAAFVAPMTARTAAATTTPARASRGRGRATQMQSMTRTALVDRYRGSAGGR